MLELVCVEKEDKSSIFISEKFQAIESLPMQDELRLEAELIF